MNKLLVNSERPKKDVIVSVRLPKTLVEELKDIQKINHFMDLSDEIRFVVRRYCLSFLNSQNQNSQNSSSPIETLIEQKRKEKLIDDLSKMIETLRANKSQSNTNSNTNSNQIIGSNNIDVNKNLTKNITRKINNNKNE